jgi:hypothetical protein
LGKEEKRKKTKGMALVAQRESLDLLFVIESVTNDEFMVASEHKLTHGTTLWWTAPKTGSAREENKMEFIF